MERVQGGVRSIGREPMGRSSEHEPFRRYSGWLRSRYGEKTYRVSVDAGFTCPVREAGAPCAYCDPRGSRAPYLGDRSTIEEQVARGVEFLTRRYGARQFLLYLQAFSNTYAPTSKLRDTYDLALSLADFRGLIVGTRPDCVDAERADLLSSYAERGLDVWVELGLQSANDDTLVRIRRGHTAARFDEAVRLLHSRGVNVATHLILGLPGETVDDVIATVRHVSALPIGGVKFHNLVAVAGTPLYNAYRRGDLEPPDAETYERLLVSALEHLRDDIVVMRLTCDPPRDVAHAPAELPDKTRIYRKLMSDFQERGTRQGIYWGDHADQG
ncbi:MAG: TIGR01212 family radical SAM protein [Spirochaetota bacterium]